MILLSRVADSLYWGARYLERAEDTARVIRSYTDLVIDMPTTVFSSWEPLLAVAGEFGSRFGQVLAVRADPTARTSEVRHVGSLTVLTATGGEQFAQVWNEQLA